MFLHGDLIQQYEVSLSRMLNDILTLDQQWLLNRSDLWSILLITSESKWCIQILEVSFHISINCMTLIPILTFTELWVVSMEHLWHNSRERLPFRTPGSVPLFGTCLCSNCWDQVPRPCHFFTRLFTLITLWYFLEFCLIALVPTLRFYIHCRPRCHGWLSNWNFTIKTTYK